MAVSEVLAQVGILQKLARAWRFKYQLTQKVSDTLVPVLEVESLLGRLAYDSPSASIAVTSTGWKTVVEVPAGKRWRLHCFKVALASGTFTMTDAGLQVPAGGQVSWYNTASTAQILIDSYKMPRVWIPQGWRLIVYVDAKSVNGTAAYTIVYEEDDVV